MTTLYKVRGDQLEGIALGYLPNEEMLEKWIEQRSELLGRRLLIIGRQVPTAFGKYIDLLALDEQGDVVIMELKRDKTPRDVVGQILDYASWVDGLSAKEVQEIAERYLKSKDLGLAFKEKFGISLPESINSNHTMLIVASAFDPSSDRIVRYLSEKHGLGINTAFFKVFKDETGEMFMTTDWLLDAEEVENRIEAKTKAAPSSQALLALAGDRNVSNLVTATRKIGQAADEEPAATYGGSFRYWYKGKVVVGVNVSGQRRHTPVGALDIWMSVPKLAELFFVTVEEIKSVLSSKFEIELDSPSEFIVRLRNVEEAESFTKVVGGWIANAAGKQKEEIAA